jgi:chemotaxis protein CheC
MPSTINERAARLAMLKELFGLATHEASAAMSRWTSRLITFSLDEVREIPLGGLAGELALCDEPLTMVVLRLEGELGGDLVLAFDDADARRLVADVLGQPEPFAGDWTALAKSALEETGNILGCAYMNALTRLIGRDLVPSPPYFLVDYVGSVLEQALVPQAAESEVAMVCRTAFRRQGQDLNWHVFFLPMPCLRERIEDSLAR